jgi:hypothetical protein
MPANPVRAGNPAVNPRRAAAVRDGLPASSRRCLLQPESCRPCSSGCAGPDDCRKADHVAVQIKHVGFRDHYLQMANHRARSARWLALSVAPVDFAGLLALAQLPADPGAASHAGICAHQAIFDPGGIDA